MTAGKNGKALVYEPNPGNLEEWRHRAKCACTCGCGMSLKKGQTVCLGCAQDNHRPGCIQPREGWMPGGKA